MKKIKKPLKIRSSKCVSNSLKKRLHPQLKMIPTRTSSKLIKSNQLVTFQIILMYSVWDCLKLLQPIRARKSLWTNILRMLQRWRMRLSRFVKPLVSRASKKLCQLSLKLKSRITPYITMWIIWALKQTFLKNRIRRLRNKSKGLFKEVNSMMKNVTISKIKCMKNVTH